MHKPVVLRVRTTLFLKKKKKKGFFLTLQSFQVGRREQKKHVSSIKSNRNISTNCGKHTYTAAVVQGGFESDLMEGAAQHFKSSLHQKGGNSALKYLNLQAGSVAHSRTELTGKDRSVRNDHGHCFHYFPSV